MYNKTTVTQLGTCIGKKCKFFVVPRNGQALLGMLETDALNIIKIYINAIGAEEAGGSDRCCTNMHTVQGAKLKQETDGAEKCYTNMDSISKSNNKTRPRVKSNSYKTIEYFRAGLSYESNKKRSAENTQQIHRL